ncbi:MAG: hypothetical protein KKI20_04975 [Gammaproteobacteria bacterium]|nr:hypothetical protein [Gammaproteobacteria bacterium]
MRKHLAIVIGLLSLFLVACATHKVPTSATALMEGYYNAPPKLKESSLYTVVAEGHGELAGVMNRQFVTYFEDDDRFHVNDGETFQLEYSGEYAYRVDRGNNKHAVLTYVVHHGYLMGKTIVVDMNFQSGTSGTYRATITRGGSGSEEGIFEVQ